MDLSITGKIIAVLPIQQGTSQRTGNTWSRQAYVLETQEQYSRKCAFDVMGADRINNMAIKQGEILTAHIDIDAHEFNGKWYNSITAYRVDRQGQQAPQPTPQPAPQYQQQQAPAASSSTSNGDGLPF